MKIKKLFLVGLVCLFVSVCGCADNTETDVSDGNDTDYKVDIQNKQSELKDNKYLYSNNLDSVVTMYLTVSKGNETENTNHTWEEVNSYSVYDYDEMGVERYGVNGLLQVGDENGPVSGELGYGLKIPNSTVTIRGQSSSENAQKGYKIKLKDSAGSWNDQTVINLNKHQGDGLRFRNKLMYELLRDVPDMVSFQTQFVHLYVKDETSGSDSFEDYGLYTQVEQANKGYLKRHGLDKNGQLYKLNMFEFYRYEDTIKLKSDASYDQKKFEEILEIKGNDDHSKLINMLNDVNNYNMPIQDIVNKWFDEDNVLTWLAFNIITGNIDTQSRNALLYSPLNVDKWYFINWDCDTAFNNKELSVLGKDIESGWESGVSNYWGSVLFSRMLKDSNIREKLDEKITLVMESVTKEKVESLVNTLSSVAKNYAYAYPDIMHEPLTDSQYAEVLESVSGEIENNYELYKKSLQEPMPFFIGTPSMENEGIKFVWDASYDFQSNTINYSIEVSDTPDFTNIIDKQEGLFIPQYEMKQTLAPGQYYVRIKANDSDGNSQYAFNYYATNDGKKRFGILGFYVLDDGTIQEEQ